jgi:hypothetical protein
MKRSKLLAAGVGVARAKKDLNAQAGSRASCCGEGPRGPRGIAEESLPQLEKDGEAAIVSLAG